MAGRSRSPLCGRTWRQTDATPRSLSAAIFRPTRAGAISPSMRSPSPPTATSTTRSADSTTSLRAASASSATPMSASARTIFAFCGSSAFRRDSGTAPSIAKGSRQPYAGAPAWPGFRASACAPNASSSSSPLMRLPSCARWAKADSWSRCSAEWDIPAGSGVSSQSKRLAALAVVIAEDADRLHERLRLANAEWRRLASAAAALTPLHGIEAPPDVRDLRKLLFAVRRRAARDALVLAQAESRASGDDAAFAGADRFLADAPEPELPVGGADLAARGVPAGPRVGQILSAFRDLWVDAGFPTEPETLDRLLKQAVEGFRLG